MSRGHNDLVSSRARLRRRTVGGIVVMFVLLLILEVVELIHLRR